MTDVIFSSFGLRENPFRINPDPRFIFTTEQTEAAFDELAYGIRARKGLILLAGEVGTGKTMLLRRLLDWLGEQNMPTALIYNSHIDPEHLLDFILNDFGVACESSDKSDKLLSLNRWLLERYRGGQTPVLIVDEAQGLSLQALEEIRLLLNFETPRHKLLQVILAGQPELEEKLKRYELRQLRQRITLRCKTAALTPEQTHGYIRERLRIAGASEPAIFEPQAVASVHAYSKGIPRIINVLCDHALINSCADGAKTVSGGAVEQAARQCQLDRVESVARILKAGSYAGSGVEDADVILAAVSAAASAAAPARSDRYYPAPEQPQMPRSQASAIPAVKRTAPQNIPADRPVPWASASTARAPAGRVAGSGELMPPGAVNPDVPPESPSEALPVRRDRPELPRHRVFAALTGANKVWHSWRDSFLVELQIIQRQTLRKVRSLEAEYWKPFLGQMRHRMRRLQSSVFPATPDPHWQEWSARVASAVRVAWNRAKARGKAAVPARIAGIFGAAPKPSRSSESRANRRRDVFGLKRWLHEPLGSRKRAASSSEHSTLGPR